MERLDAVVIGAGIGGLAAAAKLVRNGLRVLVADKNPFPGGTANIFSKGDFIFPMGPIGFGNADVVLRALDEIGLAPLTVKPAYYRLLAFGKDILLSASPEVIAEALITSYPEDAEGIALFFQLVKDRIPSYQAWVDSGGRQELQWSGANAAQYLDGLLKDPGLRRILGSIGTNKPYTDLDLLIAMWILISAKGIYYPEGGMHHLCSALSHLVESGGNGRLELGRGVSEIKVAGGRARGVIMEDGSEIDADAVISNADFKNTFLKLIPRAAIPSKLYHDISVAPQTMSKMQICLGLDASSLDLAAFENAARLIYRRDDQFDFEAPGIDWHEAEVDPSALAHEELEIDLLTAEDNLLAPRDKATLVIRVAADYDHFAKYKTGLHKRAPGYVEYKTRLAQALVSEVEKVVPGLEAGILIMDIATPLTFEEFGSRSEGAVAGWSWNSPEKNFGPSELVLTPIAGLYMAGYQAFTRITLGGVPSALLSGLEAARCLMEDAGPVEEVRIPLPAS